MNKLSEKANLYKLLKEIYILVTFICFFTLNGNVSVKIHGRIKYIVILGFILITLIFFLSTRERKINRDLLFFAISSLYPFFIILLFSTVSVILDKDVKTIFSIRDIFTLGYYLIPILEMICVVYFFKDKAINITFYATSLSYIYNIYLYLKNFKLDGIIYFFDCFDSFGSPLEAHELVFTIGLYFIYYLLFEDRNERDHMFKLVICLVIMLCGLKRIQIIAALLTIFFYIMVNRVNSKMIISLIGYLCVFLCFMYIVFIRSELLDYISQNYNINFMSRLEAYDYFRDKYSISLFYTGKGINYITTVLGSVKGLLFGIGDLHNDILKYYIELGFVGSLTLFVNYFVLQTNRLIKRCDRNVAILYLVLTFFTFIIMCSDNVSRYSQYILSYSMIPFSYFIKLKVYKYDNNGRNKFN